MTNSNTNQSNHAQSLGISLSQGFEVLESNHSIFQALKQLKTSFDLSRIELTLFLRGEAISFMQSSDRLNQLLQLIGCHSSKLYCCSTALDHLTATQAFQADPHLEFEIAGLGFWAEFSVAHPSVDFSCSNLLPEFVLLDAHPDSPAFMEQLDLALAAAAFDMEPALLLTAEAVTVLSDDYHDSSARKKLNAAEVYGVSKVMALHESKSALLELCTQKKQHFRLSCFHIIRSTEKLGLPEVSDFHCETLLEKDRILVM